MTTTIRPKDTTKAKAAAKRAPATNVANELVAAVMEAAEIAEGKRAPSRVHPAPPDVDVAAIRKRLRLSQGAFAARFGLGVDAVREWEQGRRRPDPAARILLRVIDRNPDAVTEALAAG